MIVDYQIGKSEIVKVPLPKVVQQPAACNFKYESYSIKNATSETLTDNQIDLAINYDNDIKTFTVETKDFRYLGSKIDVTIQIDQKNFTSPEDFLVKIEFQTAPPEFDMTGVKIQPLTCSERDRIWVMKLPNITTTEISPVTVEMKHGLLKTLF